MPRILRYYYEEHDVWPGKTEEHVVWPGKTVTTYVMMTLTIVCYLGTHIGEYIGLDVIMLTYCTKGRNPIIWLLTCSHLDSQSILGFNIISVETRHQTDL